MEKKAREWRTCHALWRGSLPYTRNYFFTIFSFFFLHYLLPKSTTLKGKARIPWIPSLSSQISHLWTWLVLYKPCFLWHGSRHCRSDHSDISIELDRCLLIGSTIHLGRAAWNCKMLYYNSLTSPVHTVQCIILQCCKCKWPKSELYGNTHVAYN